MIKYNKNIKIMIVYFVICIKLLVALDASFTYLKLVS